jgi:hypothetical protein
MLVFTEPNQSFKCDPHSLMSQPAAVFLKMKVAQRSNGKQV